MTEKNMHSEFIPVYGEDMKARAAPRWLVGKHDTEVLVVGGGFTGLTAAIELAQQGRKVILCEAGEIGNGPSGQNGGQVIPGFDWGMSEMAEKFGPELTQDLWNDVESTRTRLHRRIDTEKNKCDSSQGVIAAAMLPEHLEDAKAEVEDLEKFGYQQAEFLDENEIRQHIGSDKYIGGYLYKDARHINPLKYVHHLQELAQKAGVIIAEHSPVKTYNENDDGTFTVTTPKGVVTAKNVVVACGADFHRPLGLDFDRLPRSFEKTQSIILATEKLSDNVLKTAVPGTASWYDMRHSMNYVRVLNGRILFGGADAMSELHLQFAAAAVKKDMYDTLPILNELNVKVEATWAGSIDISKTLLPSIRRLRPGLYEASGFSGHGIVLTAHAGEVIAEDIVTGGQSARLERISKIAPDAFSESRIISKIQLAKEFLPAVIREAAAMRRHDAQKKKGAVPA